MLLISPEQISLLDECYFLNKVANFLFERSGNQPIRDHLADRTSLYVFWRGFYQEVKTESEFSVAIYLTYILSCHVLGKKPQENIGKVIASPDAHFRMRLELEDWKVVRFSDFDI